MIPMVFAGTVTRSVDNAAPNAGDTVTVTLTIITSTGEKAIAIHEEAPYTITGLSNNIYETVIIDTIQVQDTTKVYSFVIPSGATGTKVFSGVYNVENTGDVTIGGTTSITIGGGDCTPSTCTGIGKECGSWDNGCGTTLNCGTCSSGTCELGICTTNGGTTPPPTTEKCEFWEKRDSDGECGLNTSLLVLGVIGIFVFKMFT